MSNPMIAPWVAAALAVAGIAAAQTPAPQAASAPKDGYTAAKNASDDQYKNEKIACTLLIGNAKDICVAEVRGKDRVARANARQFAVEKETEARMEDNDDRRDAEYSLAVEKCGDLAGPAKDACLGNAKLQFGKS